MRNCVQLRNQDSFSDRLRYLRNKNDLTQKQIADLLSLDRSTYTNYELGKTEPCLKDLAKLASFYHICIDCLIGQTKKWADGKITPDDFSASSNNFPE